MSFPGHMGSRDDDERPAASRRRHASRFTYKNLAGLATASPTSPLRVLAHIDLDAYYAQCEMLRLGTDENTPLVVQQWRNIIAVNYPARKFGITRMISAAEAKKMCPTLVVQHVPSWKEGEGQWAYHADAFSAMAHHKVSLEPYRIRSREILATLRDSLPSTPTMALPCKIEKAGIDEVFVDLSPYIHDLLVSTLHPALLARYRSCFQDEPATTLPLPPVANTDLDWEATGSGVIDDADKHNGRRGDTPADSQDYDAGSSGLADDDDDAAVDWDDIAMLEGARVVQAMRKALFDKLRFRCSAGIASNKMLSKLGSSQHKPNKQTVVRPRDASAFLQGLSSVSKLRGLGGKMGTRVVAAFDTESIAELLTVSLPQMQAKLNDQEAGYNIYWMIRGIDTSEVTARTEIKSIISAKSFQPPLTSMEQAMRWIRVYAAELRCRLLDEKLSLSLLAAATVVAPPQAAAHATAAGVAAATTGTSGSTASAGPDTTAAKEGANEVDEADQEGEAAEAAESAMEDASDNQEISKLANGGDSRATLSKQHQLRLPQTFRLHYGLANGNAYGQGWRSRQTRILRDGTPLDEDKLLRLGKQLLEQAQRTDTLWPCAHLAISMDGFEEPVKGNKSIESFFQPTSSTASSLAPLPSHVKTHMPAGGNEHETEFGGNGGVDAPHGGDAGHDSVRVEADMQRPQAKRRRLQARAVDERQMATLGSIGNGDTIKHRAAPSSLSFFGTQPSSVAIGGGALGDSQARHEGGPGVGLACEQCSQCFATAAQLQEHQDWHVARSLQAQERIMLAPATSTTSAPGGGLALPRRRGGAAQPKRTGAPLISSFFQNQSKTPDPNHTPSRGSNSDSNSNAGDSLSCHRCGAVFGHADEAQVHQDWHFASDLAGFG